ncbi:MAG: DNA-(apurinic or apyrimidinic site) lyase [Acidimicrobiales bacterium]|nr:DNA-(apurinic or apyrimidinic site) lyase [Acidimicrobiales bacterium]
MAELPEIETLRRDLEREVGGKRIKSVEITGTGALKHLTKKQFGDRLEGAKVTGIARRDLLLMAKLDTGDLLVFVLEHGGQLRRTAAKDAVDKRTKLIVTFTQGGQLRLLDGGGHTEVFVLGADELEDEVSALKELGPDPVDEPMSWTRFGEMVIRRRGTKLRTLLVDRTLIAGVGPIYADEILHNAGLRHDRDAGSLSTQEIRRLYRSLVETLHEAAKHRGVTLDDGEWADLAGKPGGWAGELKVYGRDGQACRRCRSVVTKVRLGGRSVYFCPDCQV